MTVVAQQLKGRAYDSFKLKELFYHPLLDPLCALSFNQLFYQNMRNYRPKTGKRDATPLQQCETDPNLLMSHTIDC